MTSKEDVPIDHSNVLRQIKIVIYKDVQVTHRKTRKRKQKTKQGEKKRKQKMKRQL